MTFNIQRNVTAFYGKVFNNTFLKIRKDIVKFTISIAADVDTTETRG